MDNKLEKIIYALPTQAKVLDYGCFGFDFYKRASMLRRDLNHFAADFKKPKNCPEEIEFGVLNLKNSKTIFEDDFFDFIVASHVIEHVQNPMLLFEELMRICKPGGYVYIEAPSDKSASVKSDPDYKKKNFYSFWDDPTHIRPWTPAAFYRLALSYGCELEESYYIGGVADKIIWPFVKIAKTLKLMDNDTTPYIWRAKQWVCYSLFKKPKNSFGAPKYEYVSLKP